MTSELNLWGGGQPGVQELDQEFRKNNQDLVI